MSDLGKRLRAAREAAGLSLSGMSSRTGYSDGYLGNIETGVRNATPKVIRAYEKELGVDRRELMMSAALAAAGAALPGWVPGTPPVMAPGAAPDIAVDLFRDIAAERNKYLSTVLTSHKTDLAIGALVARDFPCVASLRKWARRGSPVLRANSVGILAKVGSPVMDNGVVLALRRDEEARGLFMTSVTNRVLGLPWAEAGRLARDSRPLPELSYVEAFAKELHNPRDSGARWVSLQMLARTRAYDAGVIDPALHEALSKEPATELVRSIGMVLAGLDLIIR